MKTYEERMEAVQKKIRQKRKHRTVAITALSLCLCIVAGILLPKFLPTGNLYTAQGMADTGEYGKVIAAIKASNFDIPEKGDGNLTFDGVVNDGLLIEPGAAPEYDVSNGAAPEYGATTGAAPDRGDIDGSVEITDHQVAGVLEADVIKRSKTHIFYLKNSTLEVYPIAGESTEMIESWSLKTDSNTYYRSGEMFLSSDATRLTIMLSCVKKANNSRNAFVQVISLDVSDPADVKEVNSVCASGGILSSRTVGNRILLMTQYSMGIINFEEPETFLPYVGTYGKTEPVPADKIMVPEKLTNTNYTVITLMDEQNMTIVDCFAVMSHSEQVYVSAERIYVTRTNSREEPLEKSNYLRIPTTEITCVAYDANGLALKGCFCVDGTVDSQYFMDEHEGVFRIVSNLNNRVWDREHGVISSAGITRNVNLTCLQVDTWEQLAQVKEFAPFGERAESVRFDGEFAYVCTAEVVTLTDPVFFFDLTDLENITVKDTGTIDGYSSSLVQLKDGFLLGIGYDKNRMLKVEVYKETETGVTGVCEHVRNVIFARNYKAYYIDRENNLFGIPTSDGYILLHFDGSQLTEVACTEVVGAYSTTRGVVIEDFLYVFGSDTFAVEKIVNM